MSSKVYDTMVLLPEDEYLMLKGKSDKTAINKKTGGNQPSPNNNLIKLPGILPEQIEKHNTTNRLNKEQASTNWGLLWEPL